MRIIIIVIHLCKYSFALFAAFVISWQEKHADSILTGWWQFKTCILGYLKPTTKEDERRWAWYITTSCQENVQFSNNNLRNKQTKAFFFIYGTIRWSVHNSSREKFLLDREKTCLPIEAMRKCYKDACSITSIHLAATCSAMGHSLKHLDCISNLQYIYSKITLLNRKWENFKKNPIKNKTHSFAFILPRQFCNEPDTTGILLKGRIVETHRLLWQLGEGHRCWDSTRPLRRIWAVRPPWLDPLLLRNRDLRAEELAFQGDWTDLLPWNRVLRGTAAMADVPFEAHRRRVSTRLVSKLKG